MDRDAKILRLINQIDSGKMSGAEVERQLDLIDKEYGASKILYDVNDRTDLAYYEELLSDARIGIFNRQSLIRMAEIRYVGKKAKPRKTALIIGGIAFLAIITAIIVIVTGGKS